MRNRSKAEEELDIALRLFRQLPSDARQEQIEIVLLHMFEAVEHWLDNTLEQKDLVERRKIPKMGLRKKIETIREEIKDPILSRELWRIYALRNRILHAKEVQVPLDEVYKYLQTLTHFIKVESPSEYRASAPRPPRPSHRTLTGVLVRSKSEVIIANILSYLKIDYEYEKPLPSRRDLKNVQIPDFTITYKGREFYWEHLSMSTPRYMRAWKRKKSWYEENNYYDRLIVSRETAKGFIDSEKIKRMAQEKILNS